jgi:hypothetical protein
MGRLLFCLGCWLLLCPSLKAQTRQPWQAQHAYRRYQSFFNPDTLPNRQRTTAITSLSLGTYGLAMAGLGSLWYSQEDLGPFNFFNDAHEWKQIDKAGHAFSTYQSTSLLIDWYKWAGQPKDKALLWGSGLGLLMVSSIEVFDGFGVNWGFSWPDLAANSFGAGLAVLNQALWQEQRLQLKIGYRGYDYQGDTTLARLFGRTQIERWVKDYNGHTLWLSMRVHSFLPDGKLRDRYPRWLNLAVGYGAEGLRGGYGDPNSDWRNREYRQLYVSLDLDLRQIRTRSGFLNGLFRLVSVVRIPFPALRWDRTGFVLRAYE